MNNTDESKKIATIAYITIIGTVIAIFMNLDASKLDKNNFAAFHIRQALGIFLTWFTLGYFVSSLDNWGASGGLYLFIFILWLYGFLGSLQGETKPIPLLGEFFQKIFKSL